MDNFENCKSLNDIARQEFGKANYTNREKAKKLLFEHGIDWLDWLESIKISNKKFCLVCGKELRNGQTKFCSHSCSAEYNNRFRKTYKDNESREHHEKIAKSDKFCLYCGAKLTNQQKLFCNNKCQQDFKYKEYIDRWINGNENGLKGQYSLSRHIRRFLLEKTNCKCEKCGWGEKNPYTDTIPLEIHHIDGDYTNNKEENLQVLCPNCHSLTKTHKSHNRNGRKARSKYYKKKQNKLKLFADT